MRIIQCDSKDQAADIVASLIMKKVEAHPSSVIGLATGRTMEPVYASLVSQARESKVSFNQCFFFMLDEYLGLPEGHVSSFKYYVKSHWLTPMGLSETQFAFPPVHAEEGAEHYEQSLRESGGIDLQLLGIGQNGHVGFNEPGASLDSRTRKVKLSSETIEANKSQFSDIIPTEALSMGIGTILEAKSLVMLATGKSKAEIIKHLLNHHDDPTCPATFLKNHAHFTLVLDPEAASKINLKM